MRAVVVAVLASVVVAAQAATTLRGTAPRPQILLEHDNLSAIAGWLRLNGRTGFIGADVADAMGIARVQGEELVAALQRGFRSDQVLRIAQVSPDTERDFILFMVESPDDRVYFYLSTAIGGLQKAFVSIPSRNLVVPLEPAEAELRFREEVLYWKDRSAGP